MLHFWERWPPGARFSRCRRKRLRRNCSLRCGSRTRRRWSGHRASSPCSIRMCRLHGRSTILTATPFKVVHDCMKPTRVLAICCCRPRERQADRASSAVRPPRWMRWHETWSRRLDLREGSSLLNGPAVSQLWTGTRAARADSGRQHRVHLSFVQSRNGNRRSAKRLHYDLPGGSKHL